MSVRNTDQVDDLSAVHGKFLIDLSSSRLLTSTVFWIRLTVTISTSIAILAGFLLLASMGWYPYISSLAGIQPLVLACSGAGVDAFVGAVVVAGLRTWVGAEAVADLRRT